MDVLEQALGTRDASAGWASMAAGLATGTGGAYLGRRGRRGTLQ